MNRSEFNRFAKDANIRSATNSEDGMNSASIDLIFARVNAPLLNMASAVKLKGKAKHARDNVQQQVQQQQQQVVHKELSLEQTEEDDRVSDEDEDYEGDDNDKEIVPQEFVESYDWLFFYSWILLLYNAFELWIDFLHCFFSFRLLRLSVGKYSKKGTMAARLEYMYEHLLMPLSSNVSDNVSFRETMTHELVVGVLKKKRKKLNQMFLFYAAKDDSDDAVKHSDTMNINECIQLCRELTLNVPDRHISRLFACVQGDEDDDNDDTSMLEEKVTITNNYYKQLLQTTMILHT